MRFSELASIGIFISALGFLAFASSKVSRGPVPSATAPIKTTATNSAPSSATTSSAAISNSIAGPQNSTAVAGLASQQADATSSRTERRRDQPQARRFSRRQIGANRSQYRSSNEPRGASRWRRDGYGRYGSRRYGYRRYDSRRNGYRRYGYGRRRSNRSRYVTQRYRNSYRPSWRDRRARDDYYENKAFWRGYYYGKLRARQDRFARRGSRSRKGQPTWRQRRPPLRAGNRSEGRSHDPVPKHGGGTAWPAPTDNRQI